MKNNTKVLQEKSSKDKVDEKIKKIFNEIKKDKSDNEAFIKLANK